MWPTWRRFDVYWEIPRGGGAYEVANDNYLLRWLEKILRKIFTRWDVLLIVS